MKYRPEIDGLRAVAVLPVILFHAGLPGFAGGFIGVDVFFVISGYLITRILAEEIAGGRFSLVKFYERRARRLLPALFLVMLSCIPFALVLMEPEDLRRFGQSLVAVSLFSSNILFWRQSGYFAPEMEEVPLLHTWSLAVEEQYYIGFPLLLLALWRIRGRHFTFAFLLTITLVSLALCEFLSERRAGANFYLITTRAWELLFGSLAALWQVRSGEPRQGSNGIVAAMGLAAIVLSVVQFDDQTPFPSLWTLLPVGGAAAVILFAAHGTLVARMLSIRYVVTIGLISYSAYLIHQPLFAFARISQVVHPSRELMLVLAALTLPMAWLSWRYVEQPFRSREWIGKRLIFVGAGIGMLGFITFGVFSHITNGFPDRFSTELQSISAIGQDTNPRRFACFRGRSPDSRHPLDACMSEGSPRIALIGDSHNNALANSLHPKLVELGYGVYEASRSACVPIVGLHRKNDAEATCDLNNRVLERYIDESEFDAVVLTGRWTINVLGTRFDNREGGVERERALAAVDVLGSPRASIKPDDPRRMERVLATISEVILDMAQRHKIILIDPIPEAGWNVPSSLLRARVLGRDEYDLSTSSTLYRERNAMVLELFDKLDHPNIFRVHSGDIFCDTFVRGRCATVTGNTPLYRDSDHLSAAGADLVVPAILEALARAGLPPQ